jgi:hypothetical protein
MMAERRADETELDGVLTDAAGRLPPVTVVTGTTTSCRPVHQLWMLRSKSDDLCRRV